ncbi:MAG: hypothetical protein EOM15_12255 [Spirochaetia bacterium]|nr:hypothetical protein [Spirochaetia bacterium]
MQKRILALLLSLFCIQVGLQSSSIVDDFHFLKDNDIFVQFVDAVKNEGNTERAEQLSLALLNTQEKPLVQAVISLGTATMLARLYTELEPAQKDKAKKLLLQAEAELVNLEQHPFFSLILSAEVDSIAYLLNPRSLGKGISSNSKIKEAYQLYPQQAFAILMKASSLLYAPRIAGGNREQALTLYLQLLKQKDIQLALWDIASVYSSIGIIAVKRKEWQTAASYLTSAKDLYAFDPTVDAYLTKVKEHLL